MKTLTVVISALVLGSIGCTSAKSVSAKANGVAAKPVEAAPQAQLARSFEFEAVTITGQVPGRSFQFEPVTVVVNPTSSRELALLER